MKIKTHFLLLFFVFTAAFTQAQNKGLAEVEKAMQLQEQAWNRGDLEGFMAHYWKSDSLKFIGSRGITYGWQQTLDNYKKSYPDKATMGTLQFVIKTKEQLSKEAIYIIGQWSLKREKPVGGHFTLLWKKIKGQWVIVADHTS